MDKINYDYFSKLKIRIGTVVSVEKLENSKKLLKFKINIGDKNLQVLSGLASFYENLNELVGLQLPVLVNLEPREMAGLKSEGMILMADEDVKPILISPLKNVSSGTIVR